MEAIILAGGKGTRLQERISDIPKPLAPVGGKPFIDYIVDQLDVFDKVIVSAGHLAERLEDHFKNSDVDVLVEQTPLGTGGALLYALQYCNEEEVLVYNGDTFVDFDVNALFEQHRTSNAALTIVTRKVQEAGRYGTLELQDNRVISFMEKAHVGEGVINAGVYLVNKRAFLSQGFPKKFSLEVHGFPKLLSSGVYSLPSCGRFIDIGTSSSYDESQKMFGVNT